MKYQAVVLNFDRRTAQYVAIADMPKPKAAVTTSTGSTPPPKQPGS